MRRFLGVSGLVLSFLIVLSVAAYSVRANLVPKVHVPSSLSSIPGLMSASPMRCLLYKSDAADDLRCADLGGRRILLQTIH